jgi:hypothetical protein
MGQDWAQPVVHWEIGAKDPRVDDPEGNWRVLVQQ